MDEMPGPTATRWFSMFQLLRTRLARPVDGASLAVFRISFGLILVWEVWRYFHNRWIEFFYLSPHFHFTYSGFAWIEPWPGIGMHLHFLAIGVLASLIALGLWYRIACLLLWMASTYVLLLDKAEYLNHFYLICLVAFLLIFVPAHRVFSLDARRGATGPLSSVPTWALWLLRFQIAIPYIFGGIAKLNPDWLQGQPMELWMSRMVHVREFLPFFGDSTTALLLSYGGLLLDLLIVPLLLWRPTRPWAFAAAVTFHLFNAVMFYIGIFPWLMICATTLFFSPGWPRAFLRIHSTSASSPKDARTIELPVRIRTLIFCMLWMTAQLVIPLRHFAYPGRVDWTEEGSRFAWRMMLRDKASVLQIVAVDTDTGRRFPVDPRAFINQKQIERMGQYPDMLQSFATFLREELHRGGYGDVSIQVIDIVSLNGRKPQLLVDPKTDLASEQYSVDHPEWIKPLEQPLPDEPWLVPMEQWHRYVDFGE